MRTSETDAIRVDFLAPADVGLPGRIGLTFAPGKKDRFIPWSRYPDNGIENLVLADAQCNRWKRDFLAARQHVSAWRTRNADHESGLFTAAAETSWPSHAADTLGVARSIYLRLPSHARLWVRKDEFSPVGTEPLEAVLA